MQVTNEMELIVLFVQESYSTPNIEIVSITGSSFPDAIIKWNGIEYRVEFEYKASNFWTHRHNPVDCDLIICWENDVDIEVLPTISLQDEDWQSSEIVLVKDIEKIALYWKRRALDAEKELLAAMQEDTDEELIDSDYSNIAEIERQTYLDKVFFELVDSGMSKNKASKQVYGRLFAGSSHVERLNNILSRYQGSEPTRPGSKPDPLA